MRPFVASHYTFGQDLSSNGRRDGRWLREEKGAFASRGQPNGKYCYTLLL